MDTTAFEEFCNRIGENPKREGLLQTPKRLRECEEFLYGGYKKDPALALGSLFKNNGIDEMITLRNIEFYSMCEHHILPFFGSISIGYVPNEYIAGIGGLAHLIEVFTRRLQIQETLTNQIADTIMEILKPKGVMVVCEAKHLCMSMRGLQKQNATIKTSAVRGLFKSDSKTRTEFLQLIAHSIG
ncbi:GTP cyclohydrolase I FolE [Helicobacter fennelliae]|uniref:GTP cyclohydrolase 1 n=1 Tax=Helicobacter fennelliae TaxID=215 RepID=A0A2X3DDH0_9HELI|nr:GTP cyclohydrolase I FolE [Helicobacter fennelliae]SQB97569.1 GTP cyclohydrolase I [Helicobacter fennelliae]STQ83494.1 GTP cyclohydrolase I [Helicobacter fennelliae]